MNNFLILDDVKTYFDLFSYPNKSILMKKNLYIVIYSAFHYHIIDNTSWNNNFATINALGDILS